MRKAHLTLLVAAMLLSTAAQAKASVTLRAATNQSLDDLRIASKGPADGQVTLRAGGDVRLGRDLDPNLVQVTQAGGVVVSVGFQASGVISASQFSSGSNVSASSGSTGGSVSGAFFGHGGTSSSLIDVTLSSGSLSSGPRYAVPFLIATASTGALTPVPEPTGWALMLAGVTGLAGLVRVRACRRA